MAVKYLSGNRLWGTNAERLALSNPNPANPITTDGSDTIIKFNETGTYTFTPVGTFNVEYLVVAGGGAGGGYYLAGGAGAGGLRTNRSGATSGGGGSAEATYGVTAQAYTITVGAGGVGVSTGEGTDGSNSSIVPASGTSIISIGGGAGGFTDTGTANSGGSGGGADGYGSNSAGSGTANQGYAGGAGTGSGASYGSGGGGGAGAVGDTGKTTGSGDGGVGVANNILISSVTDTFYAGGGGGSINSTSVAGGAGGNGGGGAGAITNGGDATSGTANTGGGGGGVGNNTASHGTGGSGGSGIAIIRFPTSGNSYTATMGTTDEKTTVTDVPVGSEFEQTDDYKTYQRGASTIEWKNGIPNSQGSKFTIAGTKITNTSTGWTDGYAIGTLGDTASNGITITDLQSSSTSNMIGLTWLDSSNVPRGESPNSYDSLSYSFQFQDSPDVVNIQVDGVNANGYSALAWETSDKLKMVMTATDVKFYMDTGSGYSLIHTCDSTSGSGSSSEVPDSSKTYYMLGLIYTTSEWLIGDSGVKNQWVERGTAI